MCVTSMIMDHYSDKWKDWPKPSTQPLQPPYVNINIPQVTREEFDALKRDLEEMKVLLKRAAKYDKDNNQPDCESDEKAAAIRKLCELVGVDADDLLAAATGEGQQ